MLDSFTKLISNEYYIDKSSSLKGILDGKYYKFLFTRPRRWGKTTFQQMMREFLSMSVDEKGEEIEKGSFTLFANLQVVTEDEVNIDDLLFLLTKYSNEISEEEIEEISDYFFRRNYPWFMQIKQGLSQSHKLERIQRLYARAREGFSHSEEELKKLSRQQIIDQINILKVNSPKGKQYFKLLSTFGVTCKHYQKYPTIFVEFPEVFQLYQCSGSVYNESEETQIKRSIAQSFENHGYQRLFLKEKILQNDPMKVDELNQFESYLHQKANPSDSLKFLSKSLFSRYQIPTVLIVDEYDKSMNYAFLLGETRYNQVRGCIAQILACIKDEESILYTSLTGINRFSKANLFSGLNNLAERSILDYQYSDCFGLISSDVAGLVERYNQKNTQKQISFEELKQWYNNYQINGTFFFNPFSVIQCLKNEGSFQPYWVESGSFEMILELFKKTEIQGKEEIVQFLLKGEALFCPLKNIAWEKMNQPTSQDFLSFFLYTGYLSLAAGEIVDIDTNQKQLKFVVPNKEIRNLIDTKLMKSFYQMTLESTCDPKERSILVKSAGTNAFIQNLNNNLLKKISYSENNPKPEAYFESIIFGIFFIESAGFYNVEVQKALNRRRIESVFYPGKKNKSSDKQVAIVHEYKVSKGPKNKEEKALDAIWQCLTRNYLKCVSDGKMIIDDEESNWSEVILRGIVFYPNKNALNWCASSIEYTLTLKQVKDILEIFSCLDNKQNAFREGLLSGLYGTREEIENERVLFLKEHNAESLPLLIKSKPFQYPRTSSKSKRKEGFSSIKLGFSPLSAMNQDLFDLSKCYPLSSGGQWRLQASSQSFFIVIEILLIQLCFNFQVFCFKPTQQRSSLLKISLLVRSLKVLSKVF